MFGYGSLVDVDSLQATIGRPVGPGAGPHAAGLAGYRLRWNVARHTSMTPAVAFTDAAGRPWEGWVVFLGIEIWPGEVTPGVLYRVTDADLAVLDVRERSYDRIDVTDAISSDGESGEERVFTYLPKPEACALAADIAYRGTVMARYLRLVERGWRAQGNERYVRHRATFPSLAPLAVEEVTAAPIDPRSGKGTLAPSVDPACGLPVEGRPRNGD